MAENKLTDLSMDFAVQTLQLCETIHSHSALVNQLERSSTSIGANIREASYAHGKADFIAKLQIALKECYETEYWLELFQRAGIADLDSIDPLRRASGTIRRMPIASVNTAKKNRTCPACPSTPWAGFSFAPLTLPVHTAAAPAPGATGRSPARRNSRRTPSVRHAHTAIDTPPPTPAAAQSTPHIAASASPLFYRKFFMRLNNFCIRLYSLG